MPLLNSTSQIKSYARSLALAIIMHQSYKKNMPPSLGYNVWEMYGKSLLFSPRNVHFTLSKMTIANQTQLTSICFGCDRAALSASSLVGELSVTLRDLPHTLFGSLASNAAPIRYNLRIVTDIAIVGPRTLVGAPVSDGGDSNMRYRAQRPKNTSPVLWRQSVSPHSIGQRFPPS